MAAVKEVPVSAFSPALQPEEAAELHKKAVQAALDLNEHGWACMDDILPQSECTAYVDGFWEWLAGLGTGIKRDNPATWAAPRWPPSFRGIINSLEVAHQAFVWRVRKHPRILKVFEELWGSSDLLSSFDSINAMPPSEQPPSAAWLHVDQAPWRRGVCCVQGLINLVDVSPETTGTLLVKDGTHKAHEQFFTRESKMSAEEQAKFQDHYQFSSKELPYWKQYESVGVSGKAGSLFLWDSRAVHANVFPKKLTAWRHVVYTCYQPARFASEADLDIKRRGYQEYLLSTHWPAHHIRLYDREQAVEYYGVKDGAENVEYKIQRTRDQVEDRRLLQLAGVKPYEPEEMHSRAPLLEATAAELRAMLA